jgi:hypothetical protein
MHTNKMAETSYLKMPKMPIGSYFDGELYEI